MKIKYFGGSACIWSEEDATFIKRKWHGRTWFQYFPYFRITGSPWHRYVTDIDFSWFIWFFVIQLWWKEPGREADSVKVSGGEGGI
jgi:hypothetical protein